MNDFEEFLKRQPLRSPPIEWRAEILATARASGNERVESAKIEQTPATEHPWWLAWLWPSPVAWAGVACTWLVIFGLNAASKPEGGAISGTSYSSADFRAILTAQQRLAEALYQSQMESFERPEAILPRGKPGASVHQTVQTFTA